MHQLLCRLGLRFADPGEERAFYDAFMTRRMIYPQLMVLFSAATIVVFILWDRGIDPVGARTTMWIRLLGPTPLCIACTVMLGRPWGKRHFEALIVGTASLAMVSLEATSAILVRGYDFVAALVLLVLLFVAALFRVRTSGYLIFALATIVGYFTAMQWARGYAPALQPLNTLMVVSATFASIVSVALREVAARAEFRAQQEIARSHARIEELLHSMLPAAIVQRIQGGETLIADRHDEVSIVFADLVGFTALSRQLPAEELVALLNRLFSAFDTAAEAHGMHKIKTIGDAYMAVGGVVGGRSAVGPAVDAADFALAMVGAARALSAEVGTALDVRVGLHVGPVVAGVIGVSRPAFDCWGDAVNLASRLESNAVAGAVLMSESAWSQLRDRYPTEVREGLDLKGIGRTRAYLLRAPAAAIG